MCDTSGERISPPDGDLSHQRKAVEERPVSTNEGAGISAGNRVLPLCPLPCLPSLSRSGMRRENYNEVVLNGPSGVAIAAHAAISHTTFADLLLNLEKVLGAFSTMGLSMVARTMVAI